MYKRLFNAVVTGVGFTLLFASCTKNTDKPLAFTTSINVSGTTIEADKFSMTLYFSTDGGKTYQDGALPNKIGQSFKVRAYDNATGEFITSDSFVSDWSASNPAPSDATSDSPDFTYTGANVIKVSFSDKFCKYDASSWTGSWKAQENPGSLDDIVITQDSSDPNKFIIDNWWGDGVPAYFTMNPSTSFSTQTLVLPQQTTDEGGVAFATGTYDQCGGTFTMDAEYDFPGLLEFEVLALGRGNASGSRLYAATTGGFYYTSNSTSSSGTSWSLQSTDLVSTPVRAITTPHVSADKHVYVATGSGIFASANRGVTWTPANTGLSNTDVTSLILVSPSSTTTMMYAGTAGGVFTSTDNATTWTATSVTSSIVSLAVNGNNVYAGVDGGGAFYSADAGVTWTPIASDIKNTFVTLAASGTNVWAGTAHGIFYSADNGTSWSSIGDANITDVDIKAIVVQAGHLYAASSASGVYKSEDNGTTWAIVNKNLGSLSSVALESATSAAVDSNGNALLDADGNPAYRLFYGTSASGVFGTLNNAGGWIDVGSGAKFVFTYDFARP